jgi:hypothetical protein
MNKKKGHWNWMVIVALVTASVFFYSFSPALAAPPHPARPGPPPPHPPGPYPGPHPGHPPGPPPGPPPPGPVGPPPAVVLGPPAPWKAMGPPPPGKVWFHFQGGWLAVPPGKAPISGTERSGLLIPLPRLKAPNGLPGIGPPMAGSPGIGPRTRLRGLARIGSRDIGALKAIGNPAAGNNN